VGMNSSQGRVKEIEKVIARKKVISKLIIRKAERERFIQARCVRSKNEQQF